MKKHIRRRIDFTQAEIRHLFDYEDGYLIWKNKPHPNMHNSIIGKKAGNDIYNKRRFRWTRIIWLLQTPYFAHKLIFLWHHGYLPEIVDHNDMNTLNNRIENLREANASQSACNRTAKAHVTNKKYRGVRRAKSKTDAWIGCIVSGWKNHYLGYFATEELAALAYNKAAVKLHGEFATLNIIQPKNDSLL